MLFSKQTPAAGGDAFAQFDAAWCYNGNGYIFNDTGTSIDVRIGDSGSVQTVAAGKTLPIALVFSMAELYVRRTDQSPTQVTVEATVGLNAGAEDGGGGGTSGPVAAADITDAGTAGIAVLQAETAAQVRAASGFGGTVTVAQLNAAGADARSAMYYCSDCLTVNGPGSLVAWCGRTSTWRTLDDCLLATTDFSAWCHDYLVNSNSSELRGSKGALLRAFDTTQGISFSTVNGATTAPLSTYAQPYPHRRYGTSTNANGYGRAIGVSIGGIAPGTMRVFSGVRRFLPAAITGVTARVGLTTLATPTNALTTNEDSLCIDAGNVLGAINAGMTQNYCACIRVGNVNQAGSGATTMAASTGTPHDLMVIRDLGATSMFVNGGVVASGTGYGGTAILYPFFIVANDGISTTSVSFDLENFAFGYLLP